MTMTVTLHSGVHFLVINTYSIYNFSTLHVLIILSTHPCLKADNIQNGKQVLELIFLLGDFSP